jgi:hypothetical protein
MDVGSDFVLLFSESPSRFIIEVLKEHQAELDDLLGGLPVGRLGEVTAGTASAATDGARLTVRGLDGTLVIDALMADLKSAWQRPLDWS